ncbi:hypothetical protein KCP75_07305 [Salmonella enterica subsp. enterica]|nr:hypothetical protein KCP75_07305 [Salmonella enterica subsp. enterica]
MVCRAEIFSGLHQTGELMIKVATYALPTARYSCRNYAEAGVNDVATCAALYGDHARQFRV